MLVLYPGNSQTDSIFMDSTLWWQVADKEGIVLAFVCETYSASPAVCLTLTPTSSITP